MNLFYYALSEKARPMYTMPNKVNTAITDSFDLLYKGLEITSGAQRIHNYEMLLASFKEKDYTQINFNLI